MVLKDKFKSFLLISICLFKSFFPSFSQVNNTLTELKLKGKVQSITEVVFPSNDTSLTTGKNFISKTVSEFDEDGFLTRKFNFDDKDRLSSYYAYKYNDKGYKTEESSFFPDSMLKEKSVFKYDTHWNLIEEKVFDKKDSLKPVVVNHFDINAKEEPEFDSDEEKIDIVITNKYKTFDIMGNWLASITFEKKVPISVTKREITYYLKPKE